MRGNIRRDKRYSKRDVNRMNIFLGQNFDEFRRRERKREREREREGEREKERECEREG